MSLREKGMELFAEGCNCSQAVVLACADYLDADRKTLINAAAPFGGGIGRMREVCGAVSGMVMVIGLKFDRDITKDKENKMQLYALEREAAEKFKEKTGSIICRELLASRPHGDVPNSEKMGCKELVGIALGVLEEMNIIKED